MREGALVASVLSANLALAATHKWGFIQLLVSIAIALGVDLVFRSRDWRSYDEVVGR